ncbi:hypothetical protein [Streptomyces vinaceus]
MVTVDLELIKFLGGVIAGELTVRTAFSGDGRSARVAVQYTGAEE